MIDNAQRDRPRVGPSQIAIVALVLATAAIHISRAVADPEIRILFILNSLGYLVLLGLLYLPILGARQRRRVRWVLIAYAAVTIVLFVVWSLMSGEWSAIGLIDKAIELALILLLWREAAASAPNSDVS